MRNQWLSDTSPVSGVAVGNDLPINVEHSVNDFHHQSRNLRYSVATKHELHKTYTIN